MLDKGFVRVAEASIEVEDTPFFTPCSPFRLFQAREINTQDPPQRATNLALFRDTKNQSKLTAHRFSLSRAHLLAFLKLEARHAGSPQRVPKIEDSSYRTSSSLEQRGARDINVYDVPTSRATKPKSRITTEAREIRASLKTRSAPCVENTEES